MPGSRQRAVRTEHTLEWVLTQPLARLICDVSLRAGGGGEGEKPLPRQSSKGDKYSAWQPLETGSKVSHAGVGSCTDLHTWSTLYMCTAT